MEKFNNKYRIPSARHPYWDYGYNAFYFVTICTKKYVHYFGEIQNEIMCLNDKGTLAENLWKEIPSHYPFAILHEHVIMPNHVHGIIQIANDKDVLGSSIRDSGANIGRLDSQDGKLVYSSTIKTGGITGTHNPMTKKNLARVVRWYKGRCTYEIRKINPFYSWHVRFHDRIIRDEKGYLRAENYIKNNPKNWVKGKRGNEREW